MDSLPVEVQFQIFELLSEKDLVALQSLSKRLLFVARGNHLWRALCYDKSPAVRVKAWTSFSEMASRPPGPTNSANEVAATFAAMLQSADAGSAPGSSIPPVNQVIAQRSSARDKRQRVIAEWDPSYEHEEVDWYSEYIARYGPLSVSWLKSGSDEVKGLAHWDCDGDRRAVGPIDDGTVCIWSVDRGHEIGRSQAAALFRNDETQHNISTAIESVSVDSSQDKAFIAVGNQLKTIDLATMQVSSSHNFTFPITALSQCDTKTDLPLVVGTKISVHTFDPRTATTNPGALSGLDSPPSPSLAAGDTYPLSILNVSPHSIYLAGRYPSILSYDLRYFPRLEDTIYSGARLCSLGLSSPSTTSSPSQRTLLAAGEYNGRGSLELYHLPYSKDTPASHVYKNRQTASRSKLLSVASHGTRIVFSDADGGMKWVERDGTSLVRSWNINQFSFMEQKSDPHQRRGNRTVLEFGAQGGDVVRKIIPLEPGTTERGGRGDGDLLVWTGEKVGVLRFMDQEVWEDAKERVEDEMGVASGNGSGSDSGGSGAESGTQQGESREQREMEEAMRRALMRHADEMNWMRRLGLG